MVTGVLHSPSQRMTSFLPHIGFSIRTFQIFSLVDFHRIFANSRSRAFRSSFVLRKKKSLRVCTYAPEMIRTRTIDFSEDDIHLLYYSTGDACLVLL